MRKASASFVLYGYTDRGKGGVQTWIVGAASGPPRKETIFAWTTKCFRFD